MSLYGDIKEWIPFKFITYSEPTLESKASSRQVERKLLRMKVKDLKDKCLECEVLTYTWLPTGDMMIDYMTMEIIMQSSKEAVI